MCAVISEINSDRLAVGLEEGCKILEQLIRDDLMAHLLGTGNDQTIWIRKRRIHITTTTTNIR